MWCCRSGGERSITLSPGEAREGERMQRQGLRFDKSKNTLLKQDSITNRDGVVAKELLVWGFYLRIATP